MQEDLLTRVREKLAPYSDFTADPELAGFNFSLLAKTAVENSKYFLTREIKVYSYRNYEFNLFLQADSLTGELVSRSVSALKDSLVNLINPATDHMSSVANLVLISAAKPAAAVLKQVTGFKYTRNFSLCLKGWCEVNIVVVDLAGKTVYHSKRGKEVASFYRRMLEVS